MARRTGTAVPATVFLATLSSAVALLVQDALPPFAFALVALSLGGGLLALSLMGDLGAFLRQDEGAEWIGALPVLASERTLARALHVLLVLGALTLAWYVPWGLFAPDGTPPSTRAALVGLGFVELLAFAAALFWVQQLLLTWRPTLLVLLEMAGILGLVVGLVQVLGHLPELAALSPADADLDGFPPVWFARAAVVGRASWGVPFGLGILALPALAHLPALRTGRERRKGVLERSLEPLRALAIRSWVRPDEHGVFELVFRALPREREVFLRTVPLLGIPLAFLWLGARGESSEGRGDFLALLLVTAGIYLPLLLTHVPLSESAAASWLLRTAPVSPQALQEGALKALFVRWLAPLYLGLLGLGLGLGQARLLGRLWLPSTLLGLTILRVLYPRCVRGLPLSTPPEELRGDVDWAGLLATLAVGLTFLAVLANRLLTWPAGLAVAGVLGALEVARGSLLQRKRAAWTGRGVAGPPPGD